VACGSTQHSCSAATHHKPTVLYVCSFSSTFLDYHICRIGDETMRRNLTSICIISRHIQVLPAMPPKLEQLDITRCSRVRALPQLPPTLRELQCQGCTAYALCNAPPGSWSSVTVLKLDGCNLQSLPQLPSCLLELHVDDFRRLQQLPQLPEGLQCLCIRNCEVLFKVSSKKFITMKCEPRSSASSVVSLEVTARHHHRC
jgi:hypothetical protein